MKTAMGRSFNRLARVPGQAGTTVMEYTSLVTIICLCALPVLPSAFWSEQPLMQLSSVFAPDPGDPSGQLVQGGGSESTNGESVLEPDDGKNSTGGVSAGLEGPFW